MSFNSLLALNVVISYYKQQFIRELLLVLYHLILSSTIIALYICLCTIKVSLG
jgi:hypothetical protein